MPPPRFEEILPCYSFTGRKEKRGRKEKEKSEREESGKLVVMWKREPRGEVGGGGHVEP